MKKFIVLLLIFIASCGSNHRLLTFKLIPGPQGEQGPKGDTGANGQDGNDGVDGQGCSITQVNVGDAILPNGGAIVLCGASSALISNGSNGVDGTNALPTAYSIVAVYDPCGDASEITDEVFLKMANGTLIASFSDTASGSNTRLSMLYPGSFRTTDGSNCYFSVDSNNNIYNEHY